MLSKKKLWHLKANFRCNAKRFEPPHYLVTEFQVLSLVLCLGHTRIALWFRSAWNFAWKIINSRHATMSLTVQTIHKKSLNAFKWQIVCHAQLSSRSQGCCVFARTSRTSQGSYRLCRLYHITQDMRPWRNSTANSKELGIHKNLLWIPTFSKQKANSLCDHSTCLETRTEWKSSLVLNAALWLLQSKACEKHQIKLPKCAMEQNTVWQNLNLTSTGSSQRPRHRLVCHRADAHLSRLQITAENLQIQHMTSDTPQTTYLRQIAWIHCRWLHCDEFEGLTVSNPVGGPREMQWLPVAICARKQTQCWFQKKLHKKKLYSGHVKAIKLRLQ